MLLHPDGVYFPHSSRQALEPPSLLYNGYGVSFLAVKRLGCGIYRAEVKERVELYLYSYSGLSWAVKDKVFPL
jgi:hypothetical protein